MLFLFDPSPKNQTLPHTSPQPCLTAETFALALVAAAGLQVLENLLPRFPLFPWLRLGLSYAIVLPFLLKYGVRAGIALLLARNGMTLLFGGLPLTTFLIGSGAGIASFITLGPLIRLAWTREWMGLAGASILLATGFNLSQLAIVKWTLIQHAGFFVQAGPMMFWSLVSGGFMDWVIRLAGKEIDAFFESASPSPQFESEIKNQHSPSLGIEKSKELRAGRPTLAMLAVAFTIALFFIPSLSFQGWVLVLLIIQSRRGDWRILRYSWPFFGYLAWLHLLHTSGTYLWGHWITQEGLESFGLHAFRLANVLLAGRWVSLYLPWNRLERWPSTYTRGFVLALPLMPTLFPKTLTLGREFLSEIRRGRFTGLLGKALSGWKQEWTSAISRSD